MDKPTYYVLMPIYPPEPGEMTLVNASVGFCQTCGDIATGMGGSDSDICVECAEFLMTGKARGCIKKK